MLRIALLGAGSMGRAHARAYETIADATVVAVMSRNQAAAQQLDSAAGTRIYDDVDLMLDQVDADVVDCCLPTPLHRRSVEAAAAHGRHIICEKPLALDLADAEAMIATCRAARVHLLIGQVLRFSPEYRRLAEAVHDGEIGTPVTCSLLRQSFYPSGRDSWYRDASRSGGVLIDLMIHDFDWALHLFGPAQRIYAQLVERLDEPRFAQGMATVRHRSGVLTQLTGTWGFPGPFTTAVELAGTGGLLQRHTADTQALRLLAPAAASSAAAARSVALPDLSAGEDPYRTQLAHFVDVILGRAESLVKPEESLAALSLALAARTSAETGRALDLSVQEVA